jgi:hypothetical protein
MYAKHRNSQLTLYISVTVALNLSAVIELNNDLVQYIVWNRFKKLVFIQYFTSKNNQSKA